MVFRKGNWGLRPSRGCSRQGIWSQQEAHSRKRSKEMLCKQVPLVGGFDCRWRWHLSTLPWNDSSSSQDVRDDMLFLCWSNFWFIRENRLGKWPPMFSFSSSFPDVLCVRILLLPGRRHFCDYPHNSIQCLYKSVPFSFLEYLTDICIKFI